MSQKVNQNAKAIGARFRSARSLVPHLNRKSFCERHDINRYTMQSWENGLHVSKGKNVAKFIEALAREGISCTSDWLFDGLGEPARSFGDPGALTSREKEQALTIEDKKSAFLAEALTNAYQEYGENLIQHKIIDDSMRPNFSINDQVFGVAVEDNFLRIHQKFCIVRLGPERSVVRKAVVHQDQVALIALDERVPSLILGESAQIYQILWHALAA